MQDKQSSVTTTVISTVSECFQPTSSGAQARAVLARLLCLSGWENDETALGQQQKSAWFCREMKIR